jgi:acetyl esterase/lipase
VIAERFLNFQQASRDPLRDALSQKGLPVFTSKQYRAKAAEYTELVKTARSPDEVREFQRLEHSFTVLADNEQWVSDNQNQTVHATERASVT